MKAKLALAIFVSVSFEVAAQLVRNLPARNPTETVENLVVEKILSDSMSTSFMIWIKGGVKHHFHALHSEKIYIIEGDGIMVLHDSTFVVKSGDFINIPRGTVHAVTASKPMKILSIQTPEWITEDRIFVEPLRRPHNE